MAEDSDRLKLSQLRALVAVAEHRNFSLAALELGLSQSTISHAIASLEEELGVVLLVRGRRGAALTHTGEQVIQEARQVLNLLKVIRKKANHDKRFESGQVRVASTRSIATHILPSVIAQFRSKFPTMSVVIIECDRYAEIEQALRQGQAEVGFTTLPTTPEFEGWELLRDEFVALLPPAPRQEAPLTWEQLAEYPMIVNLRSPLHNQTVNDHLSQFGQTLRVDYEVREDSTILSMVKQGLGATVIAQLAAEPIPAEIQVKSLPVPLERVIGIVTLADALLPRAVFGFLDTVKHGWQPPLFKH
ncbi:LysR family transcriptional regulator [Leptolyngbya sp. FACHB-261]|uniref:LysR family transcriptional regulator n=1 Tax=Leptolyngbya sp. FACHB-261 TaxID=2692806 RepID=UPI001687A506|nr:LysR family transcriptional regulator [Leptolyngbya sp. FACHB-261]MBD2104481.1 LysR family transcriptional regulator [Leptolyngbya sp. FACHB-261]